MAERKSIKKKPQNPTGNANEIIGRSPGNAVHCVAQNLAFMEVTSREEAELFSWPVSTWIVKPHRRFGISDGKERLSSPVQSRFTASALA